MVDDDTAADTPGQLEPTWRGFNNCDFCGERLRPEDQLAGACQNCASVIVDSGE